MMDLATALEAITRIERAIDVNAVQLNALRVWPMVRMQLWYQMMNPRQNHLRLDCPEHAYRYTIMPPSLRALSRRAEAGSTDLLLFSSSAYYTDKAGDMFYNRHVDPFTDLFGETFAIQNIELADQRSIQTQPTI